MARMAKPGDRNHDWPWGFVLQGNSSTTRLCLKVSASAARSSSSMKKGDSTGSRAVTPAARGLTPGSSGAARIASGRRASDKRSTLALWAASNTGRVCIYRLTGLPLAPHRRGMKGKGKAGQPELPVGWGGEFGLKKIAEWEAVQRALARGERVEWRSVDILDEEEAES